MTDGKISAAGPKPKISRVEVYWHTVKYRTVALYVLAITSIVLTSIYIVFPAASAKILQKLSDAFPAHEAGVATISARQARFVNLDGKVQVKKANSVQWTNADYQLTLDKDDLIQTGPEGVARIAFSDGTTYTVKGDTLVTVEQNHVEPDRATTVGMHISSGQVDLATGTWEVPGSKAEVSFENAVASLQANSRAAVRTDPGRREQEITVASGSAELDRGSEHMNIGQWERASFATGGPITKSQVLAPPELDEPINLSPIIVADTKRDPIHFSWKQVATAKSYELQVSTTSMFNHVVMEKKVSATSVDLTGLTPGDYFWRVRAIDEKNAMSDESNSFKFTLATQGKEQEMLLEVDATELHGNNVEVIGRTEPGAALIINGEQVADIKSDGRFRYFTQPMTRGSHTIVITGQNRRGGTAIRRAEVVIP
ncbi:MAG: hypothetical protein ACRD5M_09620 [Candidatus Acidiferrales bacterium]